jgi:hypothetical protein
VLVLKGDFQENFFVNLPLFPLLLDFHHVKLRQELSELLQAFSHQHAVCKVQTISMAPGTDYSWR